MTKQFRSRDSSLTRVDPVFKYLEQQLGTGWLGALLALPVHGHPAPTRIDGLNLGIEQAWYGKNERALDPPVALLSWLVRNLADPGGNALKDSGSSRPNREKLIAGDAKTIELALRLLRSDPSSKGWFVLEGQTYPDVCVQTQDALVVIEGKRTEPGPTVSTTWMPCRHQMLRHLDAAWEIRGRRAVVGFFIVQGDELGQVPPRWQDAARLTLDPDAVARSLPHRSPEEREQICRGFLGVTTWQAVCSEFSIPLSVLIPKLFQTENSQE